jgi:hypothetical protein
MPQWIFDPPEYVCPEHKTKLTDEVRRKVLGPHVPTHFLQKPVETLRLGALVRLIGRNGPRLGDFTVDVACPGEPGKDDAHRPVLRGTLGKS